MSNATDTVEMHKDNTGAKIGMWLFLFSELLLFGGMFLLYAVYRHQYSQDFQTASGELDMVLGALNTVILLTSSLTMALSIAAVQKGNRTLSIVMLSTTIALAFAFLINKYFEWGEKFHHGIYPDSPELLITSKGNMLFYGLYYVMTGLHGLHVVAGIILLTVMLIFIIKGKVHRTDFITLENSGLYWHLVDIIWIYLFPLFYLIT